MNSNMTHKSPSECTNINEVRNEIDNIDKAIIELLRQRFEYVKEVVKYKEPTPDSIQAEDRRKAVIECRGKWAEECGLDATVIGKMYDMLIDYFIDEEMKIVNK